MDSIRSTLVVFFALFLISAGIFGLFVGIGTYAYNISSGELPMCNPNIATSQATVEVRNVKKPLITGKAIIPGNMEWREAGVYSNPDDGWQEWHGDTGDFENGTLVTRTVTETEGKVCTNGTIYLGIRDGETVHSTKVKFHKD